jgi:hypothetical protein
MSILTPFFMSGPEQHFAEKFRYAQCLKYRQNHAVMPSANTFLSFIFTIAYFHSFTL